MSCCLDSILRSSVSDERLPDTNQASRGPPGRKPISSALLNGLRVLVFLIPLSYLGAHLWGVHGVFGARLFTDLSMGGAGIFWVHRVCKKA